MRVVLDCSYSYPGAARAADYGAVGMIRYLSHESGKNWSAGQVADCQAHGLGLGAVWETTASRAAQGSAAGHVDAEEANAQADALGWPADRPLYYAVDFDARADQVRGYFEGAARRGGRPVGVYGSYSVIEGVVGGGTSGWGWQCAAWSGSIWQVGEGSGGQIDGRRLSAHAVLFQRVAYVLGGSCDENFVLAADWGQWGAGAEEPEQEDTDMKRLIVTDVRNGVPGPSWLLTGDRKRWLPNVGYYDLLSQAAADHDAARDGAIVNVGQVGAGHWAVALLDLAELEAPEATPQSLGGAAAG